MAQSDPGHMIRDIPPFVTLRVFISDSFDEQASSFCATISEADLHMNILDVKKCVQDAIARTLENTSAECVEENALEYEEMCSLGMFSLCGPAPAPDKLYTWTRIFRKEELTDWPVPNPNVTLEDGQRYVDEGITCIAKNTAHTSAFVASSLEDYTLVMAEDAADFLDHCNWLQDESCSLESLLVNFGVCISLWVASSRKMPPPKITCSIADTKTATDMFNKPFTQYNILCSQAGLEWVVERRYSDFTKLHKQLAEQSQSETGHIPSDILPRLPSKTFSVSRTLGEETVQSRKAKLEEYLAILLAHPQSFSNYFILSFLGMVSTSRVDSVTYRIDRPRSVIHVSKLRQELRWGDIILFKCSNTLSGLQRTVTQAEWDHVAMVIKSTYGRNLELLEATSEGVMAYPVIGRVRAYSLHHFTKYMALRRLKVHRTVAMFQRMTEFVAKVDRMPYGFSPRKLFSRVDEKKCRSDEEVDRGAQPQPIPSRSNVTVEETEEHSFFCSELVAAALKHMQLIKPGYPASYFWPGSFAKGGEIDQVLQNAVYDDEIIIDCRYLEIGRAVNEDSHRSRRGAPGFDDECSRDSDITHIRPLLQHPNITDRSNNDDILSQSNSETTDTNTRQEH